MARKVGRPGFTYFRLSIGKRSCFLLTSVHQLQRRALIHLAWIICPHLGVLGFWIDSPSIWVPWRRPKSSLLWNPKLSSLELAMGSIADDLQLPQLWITPGHIFTGLPQPMNVHGWDTQTRPLLPDEGFHQWVLMNSGKPSHPNWPG